MMYEKMEKYTVEAIPDKGYEVRGQWKDDIHDIRTRILFDYFTYKILEAEASSSSLPFSICQEGVDKIQNIVGLQAGPGFNQRIRAELSGKNGCIHLSEMVTNSMKAGLQAASRQIPDWVDEHDYKNRWSAWEGLWKDSCIYFSQEDALKGLIDKVHSELGK